VTPYWRCEAALARADDALRARPRDYARAEAAYDRAAAADPYSARPWSGLAALGYDAWLSRGAKWQDFRWRKVPIAMLKAVQAPRPTDSWTRHLERAQMTTLILRQIGSKIPPLELTRYRGDVVHAARNAARLYPTSASLRARLAEASADIGKVDDALTEGRTALDLDRRTPHADKKLDPSVRLWLEGKLPEWEKAVAASGAAAMPGSLAP
jgi:hypothetical protein